MSTPGQRLLDRFERLGDDPPLASLEGWRKDQPWGSHHLRVRACQELERPVADEEQPCLLESWLHAAEEEREARGRQHGEEPSGLLWWMAECRHDPLGTITKMPGPARTAKHALRVRVSDRI